MNKNRSKDGRYAHGKTGKVSGGTKSSSSSKIPGTFQIDLGKMRSNKLQGHDG